MEDPIQVAPTFLKHVKNMDSVWPAGASTSLLRCYASDFPAVDEVETHDVSTTGRCRQLQLVALCP